MRDSIACLLVCALLIQGASLATAADRPKATPSGTEVDRQTFLAYKLRETGQMADTTMAGHPQDKPAPLKSAAEKPTPERKPVRTSFPGNTVGQAPATASGH